MSAIRIMLDTDVHDAIAANQSLAQLIRQCQTAGLINVQITHIQSMQIAHIPPDRDIGQANAVDTKQIPASAAAWNYAQWNEVKWGTDSSNRIFSQLVRGNAKHSPDAIIGVTAITDSDILVTNDIRFRKRFKSLGSSVIAMSSEEFAEYLPKLLG